MTNFNGDKLSPPAAQKKKKKNEKINAMINDSSAVQSEDLVFVAGSCPLNSKERVK